LPPAAPGSGYVTLVGFAVVLDLRPSQLDLEHVQGTMEDSVLQYGADEQSIHVHGIPDPSGHQVSGTSKAATLLEGYVTVDKAAQADRMASALGALFAQCQRDPDFSREVLGGAVLQVLSAPATVVRALFSPPPPAPAQPLNLAAPAASSPPPSPPPPLPHSVKAVVLTLTASGSVSDYADTSGLQQTFATAAGVEPSAVTITVESASVIITATIAVPATESPAMVSIALGQKFGTAADATKNLGITVESAPTFHIVDNTPPPRPPEPPSAPRVRPPPQPARKGTSSVMQAAIAVLVLACVLFVGVCGWTMFSRRRSFRQGRRTYLRGGPDTSSFTPTDEHRRRELARSDSGSEMLGSGHGPVKRSSSGLAHLDVEIDMDVGAKGAGGGPAPYADHFPSYADNYAPGASPEDNGHRSDKYTERVQRARTLKPMSPAASSSRSPPQEVPGWGSSSPVDAPAYETPLGLPMEIGGGKILRLETGSSENSPRPPTPEKAAAPTAAPAAPLAYRAAPVLQAGPAHTANGAAEVNLLHDEWMASLTTIAAAAPPAAPPPPTQGRGGARGPFDDDDPFESAGHLRL